MIWQCVVPCLTAWFDADVPCAQPRTIVDVDEKEELAALEDTHDGSPKTVVLPATNVPTIEIDDEDDEQPKRDEEAMVEGRSM